MGTNPSSTPCTSGGGHSVAGHSSCEGGLLIDLTRMRAVDVDPEARIARVQGGALWADADRETQVFGLIVPSGIVSETGVAGLTLGGGEGWVRPKYGLTIDSLLSARIVCADGSVRNVSASSEPDLFWAIRGGGGNFGVVTSFEFRAHPLGPIVAFAGVFYPVAEAAPVLRRWRDYCSDAPDEVTSVAVAITLPAAPMLPPEVHDQACLLVGAVYAGDVEEGMSALDPLRKFGAPLADISQPMPFHFVQTSFDGLFPMGKLQSYWKAQNWPRCRTKRSRRSPSGRSSGPRRSRWWSTSRWAARSIAWARPTRPTRSAPRRGCRRSTATGRTRPRTKRTSHGCERRFAASPLIRAGPPIRTSPGNRPSGEMPSLGFVLIAPAGSGLSLYDLERGEWRLLEGTERADDPFWSPGSDFIGYFSGAQIRKISVQGGAPTIVYRRPGSTNATGADARLRGGAWSPDGDSIVFSEDGKPL